MQASRTRITAALQSTGGHPTIETLARATLARTELTIDPNPRRILVALGYDLLTVRGTDFRAEVNGHTISAAWVPVDCWLNVFVGIAIAILRENGMKETEPNVFLLAGALAMPRGERSRWVPDWFIKALHKRRWTQSGSGVYPAVQ